MVQVNLEAYWEQEAYERGYIVVAPEVFGLVLRTDAVALLTAVFDWMDTNVLYDKGRVTLTGASNGGLGAFYAAVAEPGWFGAVVVLPGGYRGPAKDLESLMGKHVWLLVGGRDVSWKRLAENTLRALQQAKARASLTVLPGQRHVLRIDPRRLFDWIEQNTH
ncbi:MAG: alpha/beta hydrolase-fold protein [Candidatus Methylomirabilales bacterium]